MFICRHHLLRVNGTKLYPRHTPSRLLLRSVNPTLPHPAHARLASRTAAGGAAAAEPAGTAPTTGDAADNTTPCDVAPDEAVSPPTPIATLPPTATSRDKSPRRHARRPGSFGITTPHDAMRRLSLEVSMKRYRIANERVEEILRSDSWSPQDRDDVALQILGLAQNREVFEVKTLRALLADLQGRRSLTKVPLGLLSFALASTFEQATADGSADEVFIYTTLAPIFLHSLSSRRPTIHKDASHKLSHMQTLWVLFKIIRRLIHLEQYKSVMPIFDELVKSGAISPKAMEGLPSSGFAHIVLTVLLRCCIDFGWRSRAAWILLETPRWDQAISPAFNEVVNEVVDFLLDSEEEPTTPGLAAALMVRIVNNPDVITVPDRVVIRFYDIMHRHQLLQQARAFYRVTRAPAILEKRKYATPHRESFMWLFRASVRERQIHILRQLVKDLVEEDVPIHQLARSFVVLEAAAHGFMTYARTLWERWKDDVFVVGDGGVALRLVSLVRSRISSLKYRAELESQPSEQPHAGSTLGEPHGDADAASEPPRADLDLSENVTPSAIRAASDSAAGPTPPDAQEEERSDLSYEERIADYRAFADNVVKTFRGVHEPLDGAPHKTLNALARLYIMMDNVEEGFAMLRVITERGQVPDVRDINVALSALSAHNPRTASRILERMVQLGIEPSAVSFGTVIHHAVLKGDTSLVSALITRSRQVKITQLDYKTIGSLIRSAISMPYEENSPHRERLRNVENLVYSLTDAGYAVSPAMATDCIHAALRADEPVTAFKFWRLLVDGKVEHTDYKQKALRARIGRNLMRHARAGVLREATARSMTWELGLRPSSDGSMSWLEEDDAKQGHS